MNNFEKVSQDEFYKRIGDQDVVLSVQESYPFKILFKLRRTNAIVGYQDRDGIYYAIAR